MAANDVKVSKKTIRIMPDLEDFLPCCVIFFRLKSRSSSSELCPGVGTQFESGSEYTVLV